MISPHEVSVIGFACSTSLYEVGKLGSFQPDKENNDWTSEEGSTLSRSDFKCM